MAGCGNSTSLAEADGETPVRYVFCDSGGSNCVLSARFKDMEACEAHKEWAEMLCDRRSTPGEMACRQHPGPALASVHCTM